MALSFLTGLIALLILYTYIGYPLALYFTFKLTRKPPARWYKDYWPSVAMIVPAHNAEKFIRKKLASCQSLEYEGELRVYFVLDGCTDQTACVLNSMDSLGNRWDFKVLESRERVGKEKAIRNALAKIPEKVLVFSDADAEPKSDVVKQLVGPLANDRIGVVCGRESHIASDGASAGEGEGLFYRYEHLIKLWQIPFTSMTYIQGGVFSIRKELFPIELVEGCTQDGVIAFKSVLAGYRVLYSPDAVSCEPYNISVGQDFDRRVRTVARAYFSVLCFAKALVIGAPWYFFHIFSHRLLRWLFIPLFGSLVLFASLAALENPVFWGIPMLQSIFLVFAAFGKVLENAGKKFLPFYVPFYFITLHWAAFVGVFKTMLGRRVVTWQPTALKG